MKKFTKSLLSLSVAFASGSVFAAGFQLAEISSSGLGRAYAGDAAIAENASVVAINPALMTKFKRAEVSVGGVIVDANVDISGTTSLGNNADHKNIIPTAFVPNLYVVAPINDRFSVGGGVNVNYGLKSELGESYRAGVFGGSTDLKAFNFNLSGAYDLGYGFSFGAGVNAVYAKAELNRYAGDYSNLINYSVSQAYGVPVSVASNASNISHLKGDDWAFGWNAGLSYDFNENNRIGLAYHSPVKLKFSGQFSNALPVGVSTGTNGAEIPGKLDLELPAYWEVAGWHKLTDKFAVSYSYKRTDWSSFKNLSATGSNGTELFSKVENFSDSSRLALGVSYDVIDTLTLRAGVAFDESASYNAPSISIPDTDRTWYSLGATYRFTPDLSLDLGYSHLRGSKITFSEEQGTAYSAAFKSKSTANLYGLNLNYKF